MTKTIDEALKSLENNPLFQVSLGSKELFHSNYLAWILGAQEEANLALAKHVLAGLIGDISVHDIEEIYPPQREKQNIDLIFHARTTSGTLYRVVIENKVKSMPYQAQLAEYQEKIQGWNNKYWLKQDGIEDVENVYIILSLTPFKAEADWTYKSYGDLHQLFQIFKKNHEGLANILQENYLLSHYSDFIKNMHALSEALVLDENEPFDYEHRYIKDQGPDNDRTKFQSLRIHDLYSKYKYSQIKDEFWKRIVKNKEALKLDNKPSPWSKVHDDLSNSIVLGSSFTNSNGMLDFKYVVTSVDLGDRYAHVMLGVQIQGQQFRYFVEIAGDGTESEDRIRTFPLARNLEKQNLWMGKGFNNIDKPIINTDPSGEGRSNKGYATKLGRYKEADEEEFPYKKYCSYNGEFVYKYHLIDPSKSVQDVLNYMEELLQKLIENRKQYEAVILDVFNNN